MKKISIILVLKMTGLELITRLKKNMKEKITDPVKKYWLSKRGVVESVIDQLKSILHIQHTRHRSPANFLTNLLAGILAYTLKPSLSFSKNILNINSLIPN